MVAGMLSGASAKCESGEGVRVMRNQCDRQNKS